MKSLCHLTLGFHLLLLIGCTSVEPLTTPNAPVHFPQNPLPDWKAASSNAELKVVEFDDQGELWNHRQLQDTVSTISRAERAAADGVMLVVFAHGWNNSARPKWGGGDFAAFHQTISSLGEAMKHQPPGMRQKVVGVYLGWRGRTAGAFPIFVDYFHRRAAAQRVGGPSGSYAIARLLGAAEDSPKNCRVIIGHSFGGLVVERAVAPLLMQNMARDGSKPRRLADLVLLVNPAENFLITHQLVTTMQARSNGSDERLKPPQIVAFSATDDRATRGILPIGQFVGRNLFTMTNTTNSGKVRPKGTPLPGADGSYPAGMSQLGALGKAAPHEKTMRSHNKIEKDPGHRSAISCIACKGADLTADQYRELVALNQDPRLAGGAIRVCGENGDYILKPKQDAWNRSPYWIFRSDPEFLSGHGGLWEGRTASGNMIALITALAALR